jgi:hypothetical protein
MNTVDMAADAAFEVALDLMDLVWAEIRDSGRLLQEFEDRFGSEVIRELR